MQAGGPESRRPTVARQPARLRALNARAGGLALIVGTLSGCSMVVGAARMYYDASPTGTEQREWGLRQTLASGAFDTALARVSSRDQAAPRDRLLRSLYHGLVSYYAGQYERSGTALRAADEMAEDRYTKSLSRGALSMVSNDLVLPYMPGHTERLLVHYYGALGYLRRSDVRGATVEVRRLSQLLEQFDERRDPADRSTRAFLRYFAGTVFEAAGETNDASVAYRNAAELAPARSLPSPTARKATSGEAVVLLERGFIAQRVEENLLIEVEPSERDSLARRKGEALPSSDGQVIARMLRQIESAPDSGVYRSGNARHLRRDGLLSGSTGDLVLRVAWPVFLRPLREPASPTVVAPGNRSATFSLVGDLSDGIIADYRRQRTMLLTRTVVRAAVKFAAAEAAEKKKGKAGKAMATLAGAVLEHADTRSWHLLPADVALSRIMLPPGRHRLSIRLGPASDSARVIDLGDVDITAGQIAFVPIRLWPRMAPYGVESTAVTTEPPVNPAPSSFAGPERAPSRVR